MNTWHECVHCNTGLHLNLSFKEFLAGKSWLPILIYLVTFVKCRFKFKFLCQSKPFYILMHVCTKTSINTGKILETGKISNYRRGMQFLNELRAMILILSTCEVWILKTLESCPVYQEIKCRNNLNSSYYWCIKKSVVVQSVSMESLLKCMS